MKMLVIAAPGQGAQSPGFLAPWLELPGFRDCLEEWSDLAQCDLIHAGTTAGAAEITDTTVAQPLLAAAGMAAAAALSGSLDQARKAAGIAAGHSVGEIAAGAIAGVISPADAMRLVGTRGRAMAKAAAAQPTGMTAILGGEPAEVLAAVAAHGLTAANVNGPGQVVAAGTMAQLSALAEDPPAGVFLRPLRVAGAFHTVHMAPAVHALREAAAGVTVADPALMLLSNRDGAAVTSGADWLERIITQVSAPVRWDACMAAMTGLGAGALIELPPAGTLTGLARRGMPGIALAALKTPDDLAAARLLLAEHGELEPHDDADLPEWRLLVAPQAGTFRTGPGGQPAGAGIGAGTQLGHVEVKSGQRPVSTTFPATILEWLVEDGDPVDAGQPLVRLQPEGAAQ